MVGQTYLDAAVKGYVLSEIIILSNLGALVLFMLITPVEFSFMLKDELGPDIHQQAGFT